MTITEQLFALRDDGYAKMQNRIVPGQTEDRIIGVRVPEVRKLAKAILGTPESEAFLSVLPHAYYDENMLHGVLLSEIRDYDTCINGVESFLPYVDNWAVCDIMSPKIFKKHKTELIGDIRRWISSEHTYTCRFGMEMLMSHFLDEDFKPEYLELPAGVRSDEYYVNMMTAWFFATALAKQWDTSIRYIENRRLAPWTHNKAIQKARESYRITPEQKEYLNTLKIK